MSNESPIPNVINFLDYRLFLKAWVEAKQESSPSFSHRNFARRAGYKNPSLLGLIIKGDRNLTDNLLPGFIKTIGLTGADEDYFRSLVLLDRSKTLAERTRRIEQLVAHRRYNTAHQLQDDGFLYLTRWYLPAIRELAAHPEFSGEPKWIVNHLRPKISIDEARQALETLQDLGLLITVEDGSLKQCDRSIVTPHEVASIAVRRYHQEMGRLAQEELNDKGGQYRHFGAVTALVSPKLIPRLKKEISRFQEYLLELCDQETEANTCLIQLNLQLFPLNTIDKDSAS